MRAKLPVQPAGWVVLGVGCASLVGALALRWRELLVLAIGCGVVFLFSILFVIGRSEVKLERILTPVRVTVGEPAMAALAATNTGSVRFPGQIIRDAMDGELIPLRLPTLHPSQRSVQQWQPSTNRRGVHKIGPARITKSDPCRLMQREVGQTGVDELWVRPRVVPIASIASGLTKDMDGPSFDQSPAGDVVFHAIKPYRTGDDVRHVHWMATARAGELMVRHYVDNRQPYVSVVIDVDRASWRSTDDFDAAIDIAASIGISTLRRGEPLSMHAGARPLVGRVHRSTGERLLDDLTRVDMVDGFDVAAALGPLVAAERATTTCIVITGNGRAVSTVRNASTEVARSCPVMIVRVGPAKPEAAAATGTVLARGVRLLDVTDVKDFATSLSRVLVIA